MKIAKENYKYRNKTFGLEKIHAKLVSINLNQNIKGDYTNRAYMSEIEVRVQWTPRFCGMSWRSASEEVKEEGKEIGKGRNLQASPQSFVNLGYYLI